MSYKNSLNLVEPEEFKGRNFIASGRPVTLILSGKAALYVAIESDGSFTISLHDDRSSMI